MRGHATLAPALMLAANTPVLVRTLAANTAARVTTAAHRSIVLTRIMVARAIITGVELTRITATTRARRIPIGVLERLRDITRTPIGAVTRTVVITITTRTTRQRMAITRRWLRPYSGALANSVITAA